jgi:hypothetical protein
MEEAERRLPATTKDVADIQAKLGNEGMDENGYTMTLPEYNEWKRRAKYALSHHTDELRKLNAWIKEHKTATLPAGPLADMTAHQLVQHAMNTVGNVLRELERRLEKT